MCNFQPDSTGEQKTKPTQNSVRELRGLGLSPDMVSHVCFHHGRNSLNVCYCGRFELYFGVSGLNTNGSQLGTG